MGNGPDRSERTAILNRLRFAKRHGLHKTMVKIRKHVYCSHEFNPNIATIRERGLRGSHRMRFDGRVKTLPYTIIAHYKGFPLFSVFVVMGLNGDLSHCPIRKQNTSHRRRAGDFLLSVLRIQKFPCPLRAWNFLARFASDDIYRFAATIWIAEQSGLPQGIKPSQRRGE